MKLESFVRENSWRTDGKGGWGNGYVISFSGYGCQLEEWMEIKPEFKSIDFWVVGFDTFYEGDTKTKWTKEKVKAETEKLKKQLEELNLKKDEQKVLQAGDGVSIK
jgi:hypothetical protein